MGKETLVYRLQGAWRGDAAETRQSSFFRHFAAGGWRGVTWDLMEPIDVDEIAEVTFSDATSEDQSVQVVFRDGTRRTFSGSELPDVLEVLNHWTPPTA